MAASVQSVKKIAASSIARRWGLASAQTQPIHTQFFTPSWMATDSPGSPWFVEDQPIETKQQEDRAKSFRRLPQHTTSKDAKYCPTGSQYFWTCKEMEEERALWKDLSKS